MFPLSYTHTRRYQSGRPRLELLMDVAEAMKTNDRMEVELRGNEVWFRQRLGYARLRKDQTRRRSPAMYPDTGTLTISGPEQDYTFTVTVGSSAELLQSAIAAVVIVIALRLQVGDVGLMPLIILTLAGFAFLVGSFHLRRVLYLQRFMERYAESRKLTVLP